MTIVAVPGDEITDETGKVICRVRNIIDTDGVLSANDVHEFAEGEVPWVMGQVFDERCIRIDRHGIQICVNGEWRP